MFVKHIMCLLENHTHATNYNIQIRVKIVLMGLCIFSFRFEEVLKLKKNIKGLTKDS